MILIFPSQYDTLAIISMILPSSKGPNFVNFSTVSFKDLAYKFVNCHPVGTSGSNSVSFIYVLNDKRYDTIFYSLGMMLLQYQYLVYCIKYGYLSLMISLTAS